MTLVLDAGGLIALERGDSPMWRRLEAARRRGDTPRTHAGVMGQVWRRGGPRQALLTRALAAIEILPLDEALARRAGHLLAATRTADVIDAALVLLAQDEDVIVTSDPDDLDPLARALGREIQVDVV